ncbi:hypothetical protein [Vulcaniibacterium tengchongense]|uniref:Toxin CptA n=1 Tax=Vulcaniibacterium tengchongense TaxID=1273429 RepID=A0A3N4VFF2_9GAMM|nr:hypothetical protein [Vulcaniibacterium tengchongense]RPE81776.1 hypothetical protein EDC50_0978 [Vulcaniibacterium tengchongense]
MATSSDSSSGSANCRPEAEGRLPWRPSRLLAGALSVSGMLAAAAVWASEAPWPVAAPLSLAAATQGVRLARRELRRRPRALAIAARAGQVRVDGEPVEAFALRWRGTLAFAQYRDRDGRRHRLAWWPDTLDPASRRELRLAVPVQAPARSARSMAP